MDTSADCGWLVCGLHNGRIALWNLQQRRLAHIIESKHAGPTAAPIVEVQFASDGPATVLSRDRDVRFLDFESAAPFYA